MTRLIYVLLAAGGARRMGFAKATEPLVGRSPIERLAATLGAREIAIVASSDDARACSQQVRHATLLINARPEDGMTSSLCVAHRGLDPAAILAVVLADKPFLTEATLLVCERALETGLYDVVVPAHAGERGHPVYFGLRARARLEALPAGDTLRSLRDDRELRTLVIESDDCGIVTDLDTPEEWRSAERALRDEAAGCEGHARA